MVDDTTAELQLQEAVYGLAVPSDFARTRICFAARGSGLHRSDNGGLTWRPIFDTLGLDAPLTATSIVVSPGFSMDETLFAGVPGGILRSTDGGREWTTAILPPPEPFVSTLTVSPGFVDDGIIFAGTMEDGVFLSNDRGARWDAWNIGLFDLNILCLAVSPDFRRDRTLYAGTETGIFCSRNGGRFWHELPFAMDDAPVLSLALSPTFQDDGVMFAGTESRGLARSTDRGQSWQWLPELDRPGAVNALLVGPEFPRQPDVLALLDDALLVSRDGGDSWADWPASLDFSVALTSVVAPFGLGWAQPLLVGLLDGRVLWVRSSSKQPSRCDKQPADAGRNEPWRTHDE